MQADGRMRAGQDILQAIALAAWQGAALLPEDRRHHPAARLSGACLTSAAIPPADTA